MALRPGVDRFEIHATMNSDIAVLLRKREPSEDVYIESEARKRAGSLCGDNTLASVTVPASRSPKGSVVRKGAKRNRRVQP